MARPKKVKTETPKEEVVGLNLTPEEIKAILAIRARQAELETSPHKQEDKVPDSTNPVTEGSGQVVGVEVLAAALTQAMKAVQPPQKKTVFTRKRNNPWMPKDGSPKIMKFKRPMYHHGIPIDPKTTLNEDCILLDKLKPGVYCNGHVRVTKRKDGGLDIDYPIRTASQRLKLINQFGITNFNSLLQRLIDERADPRKYAQPGDFDDE